MSPTPTGPARSALTAQLGTSPGASGGASRRGSSTNALRPAIVSRQSGSNTPTQQNDSGFSAVADVSDQKKMEVLRRHLVSAEERQGGSGEATPAEVEDGSGVTRVGKGKSPDTGGDEGAAADGGAIQEDETFPIPYDAPGMDVT